MLETIGAPPSVFFDDQICTFNGNAIGVCNADSGGPVAYDGKVIGVVSWGVDECSGKFPDVHTSVPYYAEWIMTKLQTEQIPLEYNLNNDLIDVKGGSRGLTKDK